MTTTAQAKGERATGDHRPAVADPMMPRMPWRGDYLSQENQYGRNAGKPIIRDRDDKIVAVFERTVDRDFVLLATP